MQYKKENWKKTDYLGFTKCLQSVAQLKNAAFSSKIIPGATNILGVNIPLLRIIGSEIAKGDWPGFLKLAKDDTFEEVLTQGIIIGTAVMDFEERIGYIEKFLPKIDNWAVGDCFCSCLKDIKNNKLRMMELIYKCLLSEKVFYKRFAIVTMLTYYVNEEYLEVLLNKLEDIKSNDYYVRMSVAWAVCVCFTKFPERVTLFIADNNLDDFTHNKAIDKINDSLKIDSELKNDIKKMKRNRGK